MTFGFQIFEGPFFEETKNLYSAEGEALVRDLKVVAFSSIKFNLVQIGFLPKLMKHW